MQSISHSVIGKRERGDRLRAKLKLKGENAVDVTKAI